MADAPKLHVYVVAALFSPAEVPDGKMITNTWFSPDPHGATAAVTTRFVQQTGETQPLQTVMVHELTEEWLVAALNAIRTGGKPGEVTPLRVVNPLSAAQLLKANSPDELKAMPEYQAGLDAKAAPRKQVYENAGTQFPSQTLPEPAHQRVEQWWNVPPPPDGDGDAA